eukprot:TRINITY_DN1353_c0_g4_i1.p1 TRINITY_DN1353_c0_g4~~TRINITY_DN1353_c0_g4_i1.p1  ORF type:complete len:387 (-),score=60.92 TRINITY_DN1353_c0_g4_i1:93-1253(-)
MESDLPKSLWCIRRSARNLRIICKTMAISLQNSTPLLQQKYIQSEKISCESKPPARFAHTGVVHNGHVYYIGGQMEETRSDEIWDYSAQTNAFQKVPISNYSENNGALFNENNYDCYNFPGINGTVPKFARHQSVIVGDKVYSFGGYDYTYFYNLAVFDINEKTWTYVKVKGDVPLSRSNHASSVVGSKIYIFGGSIGDNADKYTVTNDFYCLDTETLTWSKLDCEGTPSIRVGHAMATIGKEIYLFGGGVWGKDLGWTDQNNDLYVFSTEKKKWSLINLKPEDKPGVCTYPFIFTFHSNLFVFGGASITGITVTNKLYMWDVILRKWTDMTVVGEEISPRSIGTSSVIGDEVILLGGYCGGLLDSAEDFFKLKFNFPRLGCIGMS